MSRILLLLLVALGCLVRSPELVGQDSTPDRILPLIREVEESEFAVPDGDAEALADFLQQLTTARADLDRNYRTTMSQLAGAQAEAAAKILEFEDVSDDIFYTAAQVGLMRRITAIAQGNDAERRKTIELVQRQLRIGAEKGLSPADVSNARGLTAYLERYAAPEVARDAFDMVIPIIKKANDPRHARTLASMEQSAKRFALLGQELELEGKLVDGSDFDWAAYRGKVVLVDFWATWCGPCLAEAPNVRQNYRLFHDRGFEVVGISLDTKREALEAYIEENQIPWVNLFQDGAGWKHPLARKYGVNAIPSVWLVDRDGKVVSIQARGAELGKQLDKWIGPVTGDAQVFAAKGQWPQATEVMRRLVEAKPDNINMLQRGLAVALLMQNDQEGFRQLCESVGSRVEDAGAWPKTFFVSICCMSGDNGLNADEVLEMATAARDASDNAAMKLAKAMACYRAGKYQQCIDEMPEAGDELQMATRHFFVAMSKHQLGDKAGASESLAQGNQIADQFFGDWNGARVAPHLVDHWICCAMIRLAQAEANSVL